MNVNLMQGVIDMHVHTNPDLRHRAYDDLELTDAALRVGARAIVIKTHHGTTMDRAYLCNAYRQRVYPDNNSFTMFGSITLNQAVGGLNPVAVETALKLGAKVVWLPTASARNHIEKLKLDPSKCVEVVRDGKVVPQMDTIFQLVRDYDAVLGTAHLSPKECFILVEAARKAGVNKLVVTHPEWWMIDMSLEEQVQLVRNYHVILERCYAQNMGGGVYQSNLPSNVELIQAVGYQNVLVSTDGGQVENPHWELALEEYIQYLLDHGIPQEQVYHMTHTIPARLLGLEA